MKPASTRSWQVKIPPIGLAAALELLAVNATGDGG